MNTKRLIMSVGMLAFVGAVVVGGTGAFFSSETTSEGNVFTAGSVSIDLLSVEHNYLGDDNNAPVFTTPGGVSFSVADIKPLDEGELDFELENGANDAHVCVLVEDTSADTPENGALADMMTFLFGGDSGQIAGVVGQWYNLDSMTAGEVADYQVDYCFGTYNGTDCVLEDIDYNPAQNGELELDLTFYAEQTRNNENFDCASLNTVFELVPGGGVDQNALNKSLNRPHVNYTIDGDEITVDFVNPTNFSFAFFYRIDNETGAPGTWSSTVIGEGPLSGELTGDYYNTTNPGANSTTTIVLTGEDKIELGLRLGAERNWFFDWIVFEAI